MRDCGVEKDAVGAEFHGDGDVARGPHSCVDDDGVGWIAFFEKFEAEGDVGRIEDALAAADGATCGHDAGSARFFRAHSGDGVVAGICEDLESFFGEDAGGFDGTYRVGEKSLLVA